MNQSLDYLGRYEFSVGEVVTVGGKKNVLAEVVDVSGEQVKVKVLTPPNQGKTLYTTRYTYYTTPMPHLTPKKVMEMVSNKLNELKEPEQEVKVPLEEKIEESTTENSVFSEEVTVSDEEKNIEEVENENENELSITENMVIANEESVFTDNSELEQLSLF